MTPVTWYDGWPVLEPVMAAPRAADVNERFSLAGRDLLGDPGWLSVRRPTRLLIAETCREWLALHGDPKRLSSETPGFLGRRQRHLACDFQIEVDSREGAGGLGLRFD